MRKPSILIYTICVHNALRQFVFTICVHSKMVVRTFDLSYTASIDSQGGVSLFILEKDGSKFGVYLRELISNRYESIRKFCRAYLELRDGETDDEGTGKRLPVPLS